MVVLKTYMKLEIFYDIINFYVSRYTIRVKKTPNFKQVFNVSNVTAPVDRELSFLLACNETSTHAENLLGALSVK